PGATQVLAHIEFLAPGIEHCKCMRFRPRGRCRCQHREPRNQNKRHVQSLAESLRSTEPHPDAGKRSRAVNDGNRAKFAEFNPALSRQFPHCCNQLLRRAAAWKCRADSVRRIAASIRDRDTALRAAGVDQQELHWLSAPAFASPTISTRTPPALAGWTKKYRWPPAPTRMRSLASRAPCF